MRKTLQLVLALMAVFFALPAEAQNKRQAVTKSITVSTIGGPISVIVSNANYNRGYLFIKTINRVNNPMLTVTISNRAVFGEAVVCQVTNILMEQMTTVLIGRDVMKSGEIDQVCKFELSRTLRFTLEVTGPDASFDVAADMEWLKN